MAKLKPLKLGFTRSGLTNRPIKIMGRAHRAELTKTIPNIKERRAAWRFWRNRQELNKGNLDVFRGLTKRKAIFTPAEVDNIFRSLGNKKYYLRVDIRDADGETYKRFFTMTKTNARLFRSWLLNYEMTQTEEPIGSDKLAQINVEDIVSMRFIEAVEGFEDKDGGYFKYINKTEIDLTNYLIYDEDAKQDRTANCLMHTLQQYDISENIIDNIKLSFISGVNIPRCRLAEISEKIKKTIVLHHYNKDKLKETKYGNFEDHIDIAIYKNHFFKFEKTIYNEFAIKNYNECKDHKCFHDIYRFKRGKPQYASKNKINSLQLINILFNNGYFEDNNRCLWNHPNQEDLKDVTKIILDDVGLLFDQKEYEPKETTKVPTHYFYADTETIVTEGNHKLLLCGVVADHLEEVKIYDGERSGMIDDLLYYVARKSRDAYSFPIIYFHNLKYDFQNIKEYLNIKYKCERDGALYFVDVKIKFDGKWLTIRLKDSYKFINAKLTDFSDIFGLSEDLRKKEAIGYTYYNSKTKYDESAKVEDYIKHIKEDEHEILKDALKNNKELFNYNEEDGTFNHMEYYKYYLKYDCLVLKHGIQAFRQKIKEITMDEDGKNYIDIHFENTISGLAFNYFASVGCFDGVYGSCGVFRDYLSRGIKGGRVATLKETLKKLIMKKLADYDACSLYSSAIYRICETIGGFPRGRAKKIETKNKDDLDKYDYYVITIRITKINKKQQIPFISAKDEDGILQYINEVPEGGLVDVVDKITFEDYINFHDIEYEIIDGVYYNDGFNKLFGEKIKNLYDKRKEEKQKIKTLKGEIKNANTKEEEEEINKQISAADSMQQMIKLMLNSAYGKTILKKSKTRDIIKKKGKATNKYLCSNFNTIKEYYDINSRQIQIKKNDRDNSFNMSIIGFMVLSMSKRIMNEVMSLANDLNIKIYYQDTDSMHIEADKIKLLEDEFFKKYGRNLEGKDLGNFHSDFELKGADSDIYSTETIILGKKCYIDHLECINKDGSKVEGFHIRLKGVTKAGIDDQIKKHNNSPMKLFKKLAKGKKINFILNPEGKCSFEYNKNGVVTRATDSFVRTVSFKK